MKKTIILSFFIATSSIYAAKFSPTKKQPSRPKIHHVIARNEQSDQEVPEITPFADLRNIIISLIFGCG